MKLAARQSIPRALTRRLRPTVFASVVLLCATGAGHAQSMPGMAQIPPAPAASAPTASEPGADMPGMTGGGDMGAMSMPMTGFYGAYPMTREASGTSWQPEVGSEDMAMIRAGGWMLMGHALLNGVYDAQGGDRGEGKGFVEGMFMGMAMRQLGPGTFGARLMVSPDPFMGKGGYPLLLATGETADGRTPLIDRQHPHDLIAELAFSYSLPLTARSSVFVYGGPVGEPAFGPPAFMHRSSGMDSPEAPITHHWLDSTHITYGVATAGLVVDGFKIEASSFRGREPDQERFDIEGARFDSASTRLTWNPSREWSLEASYMYLHSPEQLTPDADENRAAASVAYAKPVFGQGFWSTTFAWGRKIERPGPILDGWLLESELVTGPRWTVFSRAELKQDDELLGEVRSSRAPVYSVGKLSIGAIRDWTVRPGVKLGLGGLLSGYRLPDALKPLYGGEPLSGMLFVRLRAG